MADGLCAGATFPLPKTRSSLINTPDSTEKQFHAFYDYDTRMSNFLENSSKSLKTGDGT